MLFWVLQESPDLFFSECSWILTILTWRGGEGGPRIFQYENTKFHTENIRRSGSNPIFLFFYLFLMSSQVPRGSSLQCATLLPAWWATVGRTGTENPATKEPFASGTKSNNYMQQIYVIFYVARKQLFIRLEMECSLRILRKVQFINFEEWAQKVNLEEFPISDYVRICTRKQEIWTYRGE